MIKKLRLKFIAITSIALLLLLLSIFLLINIYMNYHSNKQVERFLYDLVKNDGLIIENSPPLRKPNGSPPRDEKPLVHIKAFSVKFDVNGEILSLFFDETVLSKEKAIAYAKTVYNNENDSGKVDSYKYMKAQKHYGKLIVFADQSMQDHMLLELLNLSYITGAISFIVLFIITFFLSNLIVQPISIAFNKQKEFAADSGHEFKTPLTIISANTDILEMKYGKNKYVEAIKHQTRRLDILTQELLSLAKTDNLNQKEDFQTFDLSYLIETVILPFESLAFENRKTITLAIEKNVLFRGNEKQIKKMMEALIDNAIKYSETDSEIMVHFFTKGNRKIFLIRNKYFGVLPKEKEKLFDRFYRGDKSRSNEISGYGIGLSIVKNIVNRHNGKIFVEHIQNEDVIFKVIL